MSGNDAAQLDIDWSVGLPLRAAYLSYGLVEASPETAAYWAGVAEDRLVIKRCPICGRHLHPRRTACPDHPLGDLEWVRASGRGEVYSFSSIHRAPSAGGEASAPACVGIVQLEEGVHMFTGFLPDGEAEPAIGDPVRVEFRRLIGGQKVPVFVPA